MKLCMLAPDFFPAWGGVGTYTVELVRHLPKNIEIHVVAPARQRLGRYEISTSQYDMNNYFSDNVHVHFVSNASDTFVYNAFFQYACFKFVPALLKDERVDLLHSHTAHMPDLLLQFRRLRIPAVTTVHTTISGQRSGSKESGMSFADLEFSEKATYLGYPLLKFAEDLYFLRDRSYITVSNWMKRQLIKRFHRLPKSRLRVIRNSVDTKFFTPENGADPNMVLFTGRLIAAKGLNYLLGAIPEILRAHPNALFVFIGPGNPAPYEAKLESLRVPRNNVRFLGYLRNRDELLYYYRKCAIYVAPTLYENLPIRILEAMACAKPVVATNVCAIPEVISTNKDGFLIQPKSIVALATVISQLLDNSKLREEIGRNARSKMVRDFDWSHNAARTAEFYDEVSKGGGYGGN